MFEDINWSGFVWEGKPIFTVANEENKRLDESLKEKKMEIQRLRSLMEEERNKNNLMQEHYNDVCQELSYVQQLQKARHHEVEVEEHVQKMADRERSRLQQEIQNITNEINVLQNRQKSRQRVILEQSEKMKKLKEAINWDQEALEAWLQESAVAEEDKVALIKYTHQDDSRIKELELMLERLGLEAKEKKNALDDADTNVFTAQAELDRMQEEFQNAHNERKGIISNWENVLNQIQLRNKEIEDLSQYILEMREKDTLLNKTLNEQKDFLTRELLNNKRLANQVQEKESVAAKLRTEATDTFKRENDLKAELETLRNISNYVSYKLRSTKEAVNQLDKELAEKNRKYQELNDLKVKKEDDIICLTQKANDADYNTKQLDRMLSEDKAHFQQTCSELTALQNLHLRTNQQLKEVTMQEKMMEIQLKGAEAATRNLSHRILLKDEERLKQQAMMYKVDFYIDKTQKRLLRLAGETNEEEKLQLESEMSELKSILDKKNAALTFLSEEVKTMMEKINVSIRMLEMRRKENEELSSKTDCMESFIMNSKKALKHTISKKQNLLLDECVIKLQLKKYRQLLRLRSNSVLSLQKNQLEYETMMKERLFELQNSKEMIQAEVKLEEQERYRINQQVQECMDKASKLQTRYQVVMNALGIPEADEKTHVNLLIKVEDNKRDLNYKRDDFVNIVIKNENELQALRNTLWLVRSTNEQFRQTLHPAELSDEDSEKYRKLEEEQHCISIKTHQNLQRLNDLQENITNKENSLNNLEVEVENLVNQLNDKKLVNENINKEVMEQRNKLLRADRSNSRLNVEINEKKDSNFDEDIRIRLLRDLRTTIITSLFEVVREREDLVPRVRSMLEQANIPIPPRITIQSSNLGCTSSICNRREKRSVKDSSGNLSGTQSPSVVVVGTDLSSGISSSSGSTVSSHSSIISKKTHTKRSK